MAYVDIPLVQDLGGVYLLDTRHVGNKGTVCVYLLPGEGGKFALIETGPSSTLPTLKEAIAVAGFVIENLEVILVTHIHLDHAGAAGTLAKASGAKVYVHEIGAPHLHDPSRLLKSATRIYGDKMDTLWGGMTPIPSEQLKVLTGGETLKILDREVRALYTPGHASHHLAYVLDDDSIFTGDVAAIRLTGSDVIRPALPPPEIDLETWETSVDKLLATKPQRLFLTHFGEVKDAEAHLRRIPERNQTWANVILEGIQVGEDSEALVKRISAHGDAELAAHDTPPEVAARHRHTSNYEMTVTGVVRYWNKHHPEKIGEREKG